ncbi:hypothetical protein AAC387_Pa02g2435 [Persea americana]
MDFLVSLAGKMYKCCYVLEWEQGGSCCCCYNVGGGWEMKGRRKKGEIPGSRILELPLEWTQGSLERTTLWKSRWSEQKGPLEHNPFWMTPLKRPYHPLEHTTSRTDRSSGYGSARVDLKLKLGFFYPR